MIDWFKASLELQQRMLEAQRASLDAGKAMAAGVEQMRKAQLAGQKVAKQNLAAWDAWAKLWGLDR